MNVLAICWIILKLKIQLGRGGGGQVVSVLALYSDNSSSNPAEAYSFFRKFMFGKNENKQKDAPFGLGTQRDFSWNYGWTMGVYFMAWWVQILASDTRWTFHIGLLPKLYYLVAKTRNIRLRGRVWPI